MPSRYEADAEPIPNRYQTDDEPIPNRYRTDTGPIPPPGLILPMATESKLEVAMSSSQIVFNSNGNITRFSKNEFLNPPKLEL